MVLLESVGIVLTRLVRPTWILPNQRPPIGMEYEPSKEIYQFSVFLTRTALLLIERTTDHTVS